MVIDYAEVRDWASRIVATGAGPEETLSDLGVENADQFADAITAMFGERDGLVLAGVTLGIHLSQLEYERQATA